MLRPFSMFLFQFLIQNIKRNRMENKDIMRERECSAAEVWGAKAGRTGERDKNEEMKTKVLAYPR